MGHKLVNASENLRSYKILVALENSLGEKEVSWGNAYPLLWSRVKGSGISWCKYNGYVLRKYGVLGK